MTASHCHREAGFTLVEILVSLFIFSLISVGALIALSTTLNARDASEGAIEEIEQLAAARRLMADDFAKMVLRQNRDGLGSFIDPDREITRPNQFTLTRRARPNPDGMFPRGDLQRVSWRVEGGQLIRSFLPHENPASLDPPLDRIVLDGIEALEIEPVFSVEDASRISPASLTQPLDTEALLLTERALSITLTHDDGSTTRHVFELPDA